MSVPLYMDHNVNGHVIRGLRNRGVDVLTAHEDGAAQFSDEDLLGRAAHLGRLTFTHDDDLLQIAARWLGEGTDFYGLVFAQQHALGIGQTIQELELIATVLDRSDVFNQIQYLPLR